MTIFWNKYLLSSTTEDGNLVTEIRSIYSVSVSDVGEHFPEDLSLKIFHQFYIRFFLF